MIRKIKEMIRKLDNLYYGILNFIKVMNKFLDTLWSWIHIENHVVNGICANEIKLLELHTTEQYQDQ